MQTYENAASGLKKMFIAEIGAIICAVVAIIPTVSYTHLDVYKRQGVTR